MTREPSQKPVYLYRSFRHNKKNRLKPAWPEPFVRSQQEMETMTEKSTPHTYTCNEYREEMILAGLRRQLAREDLPEEERRKIEKAIQELEEAMGF